MFKELIKDKIVNKNKLMQYGFSKVGECFEYKTNIIDNQFQLKIAIDNNGDVQTDVLEIAINETYSLYKTNAQGGFVGKIRQQVFDVVSNVVNDCYDNCKFKFEQTKDVVEYVKTKYGVQLEFLWDKFPDFGAMRREDNKKWFCVVMKLTKDKLKLNSQEQIEVINLKVNSQNLQNLVNNINIFPAYHMSKKSWVSVILNGSLSNKTVFDLIDHSFNNAK